jgi:magnesium transporter
VSRDVAWTDLLDPGREELLAAAPAELLPLAVGELLAPAGPDGPPRPAIESHGTYLLAILLVPVAVPAEDRLYYQEVDVVATHEAVLTVRKTPAGGDSPFPAGELAALCANRERAGTLVHGIVDEIAERFLTLIDALEDEIDEIEEGIERAHGLRTRRRIADLRRSIVGVRRTLGPTRDAMRRVLDARVVVHVRPSSSPPSCGSSSGIPTTSSCARRRGSTPPASCSPASATTTRRASRRARTRSSRP